METLPNCPNCHSSYTYQDGLLFICPECATEWTGESHEKIVDVVIVKDANGNKTHLEYDENYNLVKIIDAEGGTTHYEYNDFHCLTRIVLPNGSSREIIYDSLNRPVQEMVGR